MKFFIPLISSLAVASAVSVPLNERQGVASTVDTVEGLVGDGEHIPSSFPPPKFPFEHKRQANPISSVEVLPGALETIASDNLEKRQGLPSLVNTLEGLLADVALLPTLIENILKTNLDLSKRQGLPSLEKTIEGLVADLEAVPTLVENILKDNSS
jgi:hypothetical protein